MVSWQARSNAGMEKAVTVCKRWLSKCIPDRGPQPGNDLILDSPVDDFNHPLIESEVLIPVPQSEAVNTLQIPEQELKHQDHQVQLSQQLPQPRKRAAGNNRYAKFVDNSSKSSGRAGAEVGSDQWADEVSRRAAAVVAMTRGWEQRSAALDVVPNAEEAYVKFITEEQAEKHALAQKGAAVSPAPSEQQTVVSEPVEPVEPEASVSPDRIVGLGRKKGRRKQKKPSAAALTVETKPEPLKESLL